MAFDSTHLANSRGENSAEQDSVIHLTKHNHASEHQTFKNSTGAPLAASQKLLDNKTLPSLELNHGESNGKHYNWTIAVELGASLAGNRITPRGWGVDRQLRELQALAKQTDGKAVSFMVYAERPKNRQGQLCDAIANEDKSAACVESAVSDKRVRTERYSIHDGVVDKLADVQSNNGAANLRALLQDANKLTPSDRIGLIIQSHGSGADGIATNKGPLSLDATIKDIRDGLTNTPHAKLDLLDYNSCDMSEAAVIDKTSSAANDVVASAAVEGTTTTNDGQNLTMLLKALLDDSRMSGFNFGETIVGQARTGTNGEGVNNATSTLANFDTSKYDSFKKNLDSFGVSLADVVKSEHDLKVVQETLNRTVLPYSGMPESESHNRDIKSFAQNILGSIEDGKFSGDTENLKLTAIKCLKSFDKLAIGQYQANQLDAQSAGGLTTYMPGNELTDRQNYARLISPLHDMSDIITQARSEGKEITIADKKAVVSSLSTSFSQLIKFATQRSVGDLKELQDALAGVKAANDTPTLNQALDHFATTAHVYEDGPVGEKIYRSVMPMIVSMQRESLKKPHVQVTPGWDRFVDTLLARAQ